MKSNLKTAIDFANKIKSVRSIIQIVLFGSVARGDDTVLSDIDIAIIIDETDKFKLMEELNMYKDEKIQMTILNLEDLPKETELKGALSGEGILLYGKPIGINIKKTELQPKSIISYSLSDIKQTEKVKLNRAIHGSISESNFKGKKYRTETRGFVNEVGVEKINRGVILSDRRKSAKIVNTLKRFGAKVKEIPIWTY